MYDARLFNQSEGISSGFKGDDGNFLYACLKREYTN